MCNDILYFGLYFALASLTRYVHWKCSYRLFHKGSYALRYSIGLLCFVLVWQDVSSSAASGSSNSSDSSSNNSARNY